MNTEALLKSLTFEQKVAQFMGEGTAVDLTKDGRFDAKSALEQYPYGLGAVMVPLDMSPTEIGEWVADMRRCFAEVTPVPPIVMCESLHGVLGKGTTVFPQSIGMGASFDPELMGRVATAIGREAKALGIRMSLAPDLDLGREPRWGRIEETFGEASYLTEKMGEAYVGGLTADDGKYVAVIKHFAAHGSPERGINIGPVTVTPEQLADTYLPPFKAALDAGALGVMPAYSTLNGVPCHVNTMLMNGILREKWGFDGIVISDFGAIGMLKNYHKTAETLDELAVQIIEHGIDFHVSPLYTAVEWQRLIDEGKITEEALDRAVLRILNMKDKVGIFDMPMPSAEVIKRTVHSPAHLALAREAAEKSIVLMKNDGVLPLKPKQKVAVVGPNAFSVQLGDYALPKPNALTPAEAIEARANECGGSVISAKGCDVFGHDTSGFAEAEKAANEADAVVCIIGGKSMKGYGIGWGSEEESILTCGEGCDVDDLTPGGPQLELVRRMIATSKPVVVVMIDGRPETLHDVADDCDALLAAWYPGEEGSTALARLLYGDCDFTARLPVTFPRSVGQLPLCHDRVYSNVGFYRRPGTPDKPGRDYVFSRTDEAFPFAHGLKYSEIAYGSLTVNRTDFGLTVGVTVENKGRYDAVETVPVFISDEVASIPQPIKKLVGLGKANVPAGESRTVTVDIPVERLMFTDTTMTKRLEAGWFTVTAGDCTERIYVE